MTSAAGCRRLHAAIPALPAAPAFGAALSIEGRGDR